MVGWTHAPQLVRIPVDRDQSFRLIVITIDRNAQQLDQFAWIRNAYRTALLPL
jgi:hypothetical protein